MGKIFDLPAHPFFVHLPIVLLPVAVLLALYAVARPTFRDRYGRAIAAVAGVSFIGTFLAKESGEEMFEIMQRTPNVDKHQSLAQTTLIVAFVFALSFAGLVFSGRRSVLKAQQRWLTPTLMAVTVVSAIISAIWIARTGHEGAKLNWDAISGGG